MYSALAAAVALAGVAVGTPVQKRAAGGVNMLYWGADSYNQGLAQYCKQDTADVIALSMCCRAFHQAKLAQLVLTTLDRLRERVWSWQEFARQFRWMFGREWTSGSDSSL